MFQATRKKSTHAGIFLIVLVMALWALSWPAYANKYRTDAWDGKFRYGAYSTLISSHILGMEFRDLIKLLNDPEVNLAVIYDKIRVYQMRYEGLSEEEIDNIIRFAHQDQTSSIYEEERSVVSTLEQNNAFINGMAMNRHLAPVDRLVRAFRFSSGNFQFSTHRALYNDAYEIPQNSLAGIINAYVAGIRNIEFDVLDTRDYKSILVHDLVTNRLDGNYMQPPIYVEKTPFKQVKDTAVDVLIPLKDAPLTEKTDVKIITTARVFQVVHHLMPQMTLYVDARNDAPLSVIKLLYEHPEYRNNVVIKIYPFTLAGGLTDLVERYARRYHDGNIDWASQEIALVNPHVLLAIGHAEMEASDRVALSGVMDFGPAEFWEQTKYLPFARNSQLSYKEFNGAQIFTSEELAEIEDRTFRMFRWTMGLTGITNTLVFQMAALPSLEQIIARKDIAEYTAMDKEKDKRYKVSAAIHDNFLELYKRVKNGDLRLRVRSRNGYEYDLSGTIEDTYFGLSDRYPDFAFAKRLSGDVVKQDTLVSFNYSMLGSAAKSDGYQPEKVRSTTALLERANELAAITHTATVYATTDLPTDLRLAFMGLLGEHGLPDDIKYRPSGVIKEKHAIDPSTFKLPAWLENFGK